MAGAPSRMVDCQPEKETASIIKLYASSYDSEKTPQAGGAAEACPSIVLLSKKFFGAQQYCYISKGAI